MSRRPPKPLTLPELEKAKALYALGKSYHAVGLELNRDSKTIKKHLTMPQVAEEVRELEKEIAKLYENLSEKILKSIGGETIREAKLRDRVISAGICTDKSRLIKGESSVNFASISQLIMEADKLPVFSDAERKPQDIETIEDE
jgi:hypothetical protein